MFIKGITEIAIPLFKLLNKEQKFSWSEREEQAFKEIKNRWKDELELITPIYQERFIIESDASDLGLGAVLRQKAEPICYISRTLTSVEKNDTILEKEVLAAIWAMDKFAFYIAGKEFDLITNHQAIEFIKKKERFWDSEGETLGCQIR